MKTTANPWGKVMLTYSQTGKLPLCPYCSQDTLTAEQNIMCAHIALYIFCSNCEKWIHVDGHLKN